jgi:uncharacterized protein
MRVVRLLYGPASALLLAGCVPVSVHQDSVVKTNLDVAVAGQPAVAARVGPAYRFTANELPAPFGTLHTVLAESDPHKPLIVFCGGNAFRENAGGARTVEALAPFGDMLLFDYPGLGESRGAGTKQDYAAALDTVTARVAQIAKTRSGPLVFWGHSLGGGFCAALAARSRTAAPLVMAGAFASLDDAAQGIVADRVWFSPLVSTKIEADAVNFDVPALLAAYDGPIVVVASKADRTIPFAVSEKLARKLQGENRKVAFVALENAGHSGMQQTPEFRARLTAALAPYGIKPVPLPEGASSQLDGNPCGTMHVANGCGTLLWPDGSRYVGGFHNGLFNGRGLITYADGDKLEVDYADGNGAGAARYTLADGSVLSGPFRDNEIVGDTPQGQGGLAEPLPQDGSIVLISAIVREDGSIANAMAELPKGVSDTDAGRILAATTHVLAQRKYRPASINGRPVKAPLFLPMRYVKSED